MTSGLPWLAIVYRNAESVTPSMGESPMIGVGRVFQNVIAATPRELQDQRERWHRCRPSARHPLPAWPRTAMKVTVPRRTPPGGRSSAKRNHTADRLGEVCET